MICSLRFKRLILNHPSKRGPPSKPSYLYIILEPYEPNVQSSHTLPTDICCGLMKSMLKLKRDTKPDKDQLIIASLSLASINLRSRY